MRFGHRAGQPIHHDGNEFAGRSQRRFQFVRQGMIKTLNLLVSLKQVLVRSFELGLDALHPFLTLLAFRDVTRKRNDVGDFPPLITNHTVLGLNETNAAVREQVTKLGALASAGPSGLLKQPAHSFPILRMNLGKGIGAWRERRLIKDRFVGRTVVEPFAFQIQDRDQISNILRNLPEHFSAPMEMHFRELSLGLLLLFAQGPFNGRPQALEPIFDHIIRRPFLQALNGRLFSQRARNKNKRDAG